ncbi:MAG: outer membrane lipoprotein carrier protein LolA [Fibrobacter sp.]|nr:outer membrane lipoprotein carrier protein LolA [Fibrobacter sp.]
MHSIFRYLILLTLTFSPLHASEANEVLNKSKNWFKESNYWSLEFHVKIFHAGSTDVSEQRGDILIGKDNLYRLRIPGITFFNDGQSFWQWNIDQKQVLIKDIEDLANTPHPSELLFKYLECDALSLKKDKWKNSAVYVLKLDPSKYKDQFKSLEVWLSTKDYSPIRLFTTDLMDNASVYEISNLKRMKNVAPQNFKYTGIKGVEEIDMR